MYRHFATVTVAMTALMAFFANGENRKAVAATNAAEQPTEPQPAAAKPRLEVPPDADVGSWGDDSDFMGQPDIGAYVRSPAPLSNPFGLDASRRASTDLSELDREDGYDEEAGEAPDAPTASQIAAATAASRLRSGAGGSD